MVVASVDGLLRPGLAEGSTAAVLGGIIVGVAFLLGARWTFDSRERRRSVQRSPRLRLSVLVFTVLFVHSLPEGFAIGTAYASDTAGLSLFVIVAIAIQNVPEGTSVALPMAAAGFSRSRQFWAAVGTSAPQPVGAVVAYFLVEEISTLLPVSFGFAAGAMLALVAIELMPEAFRDGAAKASIGAALGASGMLWLGSAMGV
jgi:ZIP family zinc transporter